MRWAQVKADEALTSSQTEADVLAIYTSHANACVAKPLTAQDFADVVRRIGGFFGTIARLPR